MKFKVTKKEIKACPAKGQQSGGFALLFSVLVASLLLTIGLSIFNIALKELAISTNINRSIHAFYAADSGREYAIYEDIRNGSIFSDIEITAIADELPSNDPTGNPRRRPIINYTPVDESAGPNYYVTIEKKKNTNQGVCDTNKVICTTITSYGQDSTGNDRVQRAIEQTY